MLSLRCWASSAKLHGVMYTVCVCVFCLATHTTTCLLFVILREMDVLRILKDLLQKVTPPV